MPNVLVHMEIVEDWALRNENSTCSGPRTVKPLSMATAIRRSISSRTGRNRHRSSPHASRLPSRAGSSDRSRRAVRHPESKRKNREPDRSPWLLACRRCGRDRFAAALSSRGFTAAVRRRPVALCDSDDGCGVHGRPARSACHSCRVTCHSHEMPDSPGAWISSTCSRARRKPSFRGTPALAWLALS
jgi:hypothetical protein